MKTNDQQKKPQHPTKDAAVDQTRRVALRRLGRFAAITPPAVTMLLSAAAKPASALTSTPPISSRQFKEPVSVPQLQHLV
jgi:hypothetical protein